MTILLHGTTRHRAELLVAGGPDPDYVEPDPADPQKPGTGPRAENFSTYLEGGPFPYDPPEKYACDKAALFANERGAAILAVDVPDDLIALAVDEWLPRSQGLIQFDEGKGLEELRAAWPALWKEIRPVECP